MSVLSINSLSKSYGRIKAVNNLNLEIEAGNVYGILGPNGSGKTTTLGLILGIIRPDSGDFTWFENEFKTPNLRIGAILETPNFVPYLDAIDNLAIVAGIKNVKDPQIDHLLEMVDLASRKKSKFRTYSLGMKQRLAIAATLISDPDAVIFDEPTNGLDPEGIFEVRRILKRVADSGRTVIMASHLLSEVEKICSHVAIIKNGTLLAQGEIGAILSNDITVELDAHNKSDMIQWIDNIPWLKLSNQNNSWIECQMQEGHEIAEVNKMAFDAGIVLTRVVARKRKLEEEFLQITQGN